MGIKEKLLERIWGRERDLRVKGWTCAGVCLVASGVCSFYTYRWAKGGCGVVSFSFWEKEGRRRWVWCEGVFPLHARVRACVRVSVVGMQAMAVGLMQARARVCVSGRR